MQKTFPFLLTKYESEPITLEEARQWLRMDLDGFEDDDAEITRALNAAIDQVENELDCNLCVSTYQWNAYYFPCGFGGKTLVRSIESIQYHDGTSYQALDTAKYALVRTGEFESRIVYSGDMPDLCSTTFPVIITFTAGYELGKVPERILQAVRSLLGEFYCGFMGDSVSEKRTLSDKLLSGTRIPFPA